MNAGFRSGNPWRVNTLLDSVNSPSVKRVE
jgi:hypothetical protein